jgi:hypothetical protein
MQKIRVTIEIETKTADGTLSIVREIKEQDIESVSEIENIDSCERHLLETGYEAMRQALGSQMCEVSKKNSQTQPKRVYTARRIV